MKSKRKDTIKQRVTSRFKGLGAIMLALFMILTDMSLMPPVEAEAATGDQYWIIGFVFYSDPLFCTGQEGNYISGNVYEVLDDTNNGMDNGYVRYYSGFKLSEGSPLTSLGTLNDSGFEIKISPEEDTYVNAGCVQRSKGYRDCGFTTTHKYLTILEFTHFCEFFTFNKIDENHKEKSIVHKITVNVALELVTRNTKTGNKSE